MFKKSKFSKHFFDKNYEQSRLKLGTFLEHKYFKIKIFKTFFGKNCEQSRQKLGIFLEHKVNHKQSQRKFGTF